MITNAVRPAGWLAGWLVCPSLLGRGGGHCRQFVVMKWTDPAYLAADVRGSQSAEVSVRVVQTRVASQRRSTHCRRHRTRRLEHCLGRQRLGRLAVNVHHAFTRTYQHLQHHTCSAHHAVTPRHVLSSGGSSHRTLRCSAPKLLQSSSLFINHRPPIQQPQKYQHSEGMVIIIIIIIIIIIMFQRISVAIKRFNAVLLHDGFLLSDHPD